MRLYEDSKLSEYILRGTFEYSERQFLRRFLKKNDVFVDVGANTGLFTLEAAWLTRQGGQVFAFEPEPEVFCRLTENVQLNRLRNVHLFNLALSDRNGTADLTISKDGYDAWNSLGHPIAGCQFDIVAVPTRTWSAFVKQEGLVGRIDMAKIDVEGWETRVLRGGTADFLRLDAPVLQIEFTQKAALNAGSSCSELYSELERLQYVVSSYDPIANRLVVETERRDHDYRNLYAVKDIQAVNKRLAS